MTRMDAPSSPREPRQSGPRGQNEKKAAGLPYTGADTTAELTALHVLERKVGEQVYTGPATGTQLIALRHLEHIASEQASKAATALIEDAPTLVDALAPTLIPEQRERVHRATDRRERRIVLALRELAAVPWPLYAVLAVQCVLSLHLIWANTA